MVDQLTAVDALMASVSEEKRRLMNKSQAVSALCWIPRGWGGYLDQVLLGMCCWLLRTPTPL